MKYEYLEKIILKPQATHLNGELGQNHPSFDKPLWILSTVYWCKFPGEINRSYGAKIFLFNPTVCHTAFKENLGQVG